MSRVYFHAQESTAALRGSERGWLAHIARGPAEAAWDLHRIGNGLERATAILGLVPEVPDGLYGANYLHTYLREAQTNRGYESIQRLTSALAVKLRVEDLDLEVAGHRLSTSNIELNTALRAGADTVALAAKLHGWCESHCWVEGPDRAWLADLIDVGLADGIYRQGHYYTDLQGGRGWASQGWEQVTQLLRETDTGPVVLSYSVCDGFPNAEIATWMPPWPAGVPETWDALTEEQQNEREQHLEQWHDLPASKQWHLALKGLRQRRPWARLSADTLRNITFHVPVTVYDLFAPDRDDRVRAAFADNTETPVGGEPQ